MKDLISKATFSFVMAQLFPGAVAAFAVAFAYFTIETQRSGSILQMANNVLSRWATASVPQTLFLLSFCLALGMLIHGLHWATLGSLEHRNRGTVYRTAWHRRAIWKQICGGPYRLLADLLVLFCLTRDLRCASIDENVGHLKSELMPQFQFLEDFYLANGQFFMHTAYALMLVFGAITTYIIAYGPTARRGMLLSLTYLLIGLFFTLGRITLRSLFTAEEELVKRS
jgi:hypothetical protein